MPRRTLAAGGDGARRCGQGRRDWDDQADGTAEDAHGRVPAIRRLRQPSALREPASPRKRLAQLRGTRKRARGWRGCALLQVIPQAGQRAAGVQLRYRVQAGREVLSGRPVPRLDLADHVVPDGGPGGQVLLGQPCPGPVKRSSAPNTPAGVPARSASFGICSASSRGGRDRVGDQWASGPIPFPAVATSWLTPETHAAVLGGLPRPDDNRGRSSRSAPATGGRGAAW